MPIWLAVHLCGVGLVFVCLMFVNGVLLAVTYPLLSAATGFIHPWVPSFLALWGVPFLVYAGLFAYLRDWWGYEEKGPRRLLAVGAPWIPIVMGLQALDAQSPGYAAEDQLGAEWAPVLVPLLGLILWGIALVALARKGQERMGDERADGGAD